jgi:hypothetical protein
MVVYAEHYAGDGWLLRKIYEMEDDCVNFLACSDGTSKVQRLVTWKKPDDGFVKLDVDGSLLGNPGRLGFGGLLRNDRSRMIDANGLPCQTRHLK